MSLRLATRLPLTAATSVIAITAATGAWADVTAAEVWQNMNAPLAGLGLTVSAEASTNGNITTYNDIRYDFSLPMGIGGGSMTSPSVALIENSDGTVTVQYPNNFELELSAFIAGEGSVSAQMVFQTTEDNALEAAGSPGDITYTGTTGNVLMTLGDITVDGEPFDAISMSADIQSSGTLTQRIIEGDLVQIVMDMTSGPMQMDMTMQMGDPNGGIVAEIFQLNEGNVTHIEMALPAGGSDLLNLAPAFAQGLSLSFTSDTDGTQQRQTVTTDLGIAISDQTTSSGATTAAMSLDASGFTLDADMVDLVVEMQDPTIPFPVNFDMAAAEARYAFPLSADPAPQDFAFLLSLDGLRMGSDIWDIIDPNKELDRSPANFNIDLTGSTILSADVTNFLDFGMRVDSGEMVATIEELNLNAFDLGALGATATATAALTFDNSDWITLPGMPKPVGSLDFSLNGLTAAMNQLVAVGAIAQDEVFGMNMMMGMVATSSGDDQMSGSVELGEDGSITANGMRLR